MLWSPGRRVSHLLCRVRSRGSRQVLLVALLRPRGDAGQRCWGRARPRGLQVRGAGWKATGSPAVGSTRAGTLLFSTVLKECWSG